MNDKKEPNVTLHFIRGESAPELTAKLIAECERRNNANPDLVRINRNTWARKKDLNHD